MWLPELGRGDWGVGVSMCLMETGFLFEKMKKLWAGIIVMVVQYWHVLNATETRWLSVAEMTNLMVHILIVYVFIYIYILHTHTFTT